MRRVRYYLGGALFWGAFLAVCVLLFWNAQRLARAAGGISLRYGEALEPRVVASALEYARDGRNNAAWAPTIPISSPPVSSPGQTASSPV